MKLTVGLVHFYYGMGCGKTSLTIGHIIRALGHQLHPVLVQFLKKHDPSEKSGYYSGEYVTLSEQLGVPIFQFGSYGFVRTPEQIEANRQYAEQGLQKLKEIFTDPTIDLVVLDEIGSMIALELIQPAEIIALLKLRHPQLEVIMTGHQMIPEFKDHVDYQIHLESQKHPFEQGIQARKGIEF